MRFRKNIMVLDTETTGDFGQPLVHDLGYIIIDKDFNTLKQTRHLVENVRSCKWALNYSEFYRSKDNLYNQQIENGDVDIKLWNAIMKEFKDDIKRYNVNVICAYNVAFDFRALNFTNKFLNNGDTYFEDLLTKNLYLCIWNLACETILQKEDFKLWCKENNKMSECGNYRTNAETTYQYLFSKLDFEEEHTALNDVIIEKDILKYIIENTIGTCEYGLQYSCWRKVQN